MQAERGIHYNEDCTMQVPPHETWAHITADPAQSSEGTAHTVDLLFGSKIK